MGVLQVGNAKHKKKYLSWSSHLEIKSNDHMQGSFHKGITYKHAGHLTVAVSVAHT